MATGWTWPLVTSVLRLVFISTLTVVNWAALYRVVSTKKCKAGRRQERLLVVTIIVVSLVYLSVVWCPFTFTALKHDIGDLYQTREDFDVDAESSVSLPKPLKLHNDIHINNIKQQKEDKFTVEYVDLLPSVDVLPDPRDIKEEFTVEYLDLSSDDEDDGADNDDTDNEYNEEFTVEYIDIRTGEPVTKNPVPRIPRAAPEKLNAAWTVFFHSQPKESLSDTQNNISVHSVKEELTSAPEKISKGKTDTLYWNSDIQDLVTSSCAYSLALTAVMRLLIMRGFKLCSGGGWVLGLWSGLAVGIPGAITLLVRTIGKTTTHFAPHQPEYTAAGYFLYNIICDVHISEEYVVSVFLEWAALFTLILMILAVIFVMAAKSNTEEVDDTYGPLQEEGNSWNSNVETWARDVVIIVGAIWSWPVKPLLVLILYSLYGSHWTNVVCWIAHVVVAIPVVFIPLAVFLSRSQSDKSSLNIYVIDEDRRFSQDQTSQENGSKEEIKNNFDNLDKVQNNSSDSLEQNRAKDGSPASGHQRKEDGRNQARENLKFYLGKDIFKYGFKSSSKKDDDRRVILANEWGETSISEA